MTAPAASSVSKSPTGAPKLRGHDVCPRKPARLAAAPSESGRGATDTIRPREASWQTEPGPPRGPDDAPAAPLRDGHLCRDRAVDDDERARSDLRGNRW